MSSLLLRNIGWLYACDDRDTLIENAYVHVVDGRVAALGREPCPVPSAERSIDLRGCIVVPGLVNVHHHFFQSVTRAIPMTQRADVFGWLFGLYPLWAELDEDALQAATAAACAELLLSGATTSADHSYLMPADAGDLAAAQIETARELGIRLHLVRGCLPTMEADLADRLRPLMQDRLDRIIDDEDTVLASMRGTLSRFQDGSRYSMTRIDLGPTTSTYRKPVLMGRVAALANEFGAGLHTHYQPRPVEYDMAKSLLGTTPLGFLRDSGWLRPRTWFAHCTELSDEEIDAFADAGCGVSHCPRTAVRLGYKVPRITRMRQRGVTVGIGVDGAASNDSGSMLGEVRLAHLLHRLNAGAETVPERDWLTPYDTLLMATRNGARILGRDDIGSLAPGMAADIAAFDLRRAAYVGAVADPLGGLVLAGSDASAALTVVNGRIVVENGRLTSADEAAIVVRGNRAAERLLSAAERRTGLAFRRAAGEGRRPSAPA
ncbi:MAG: 8-oxoguanine deaminase [Betaproteobacteria bacterium]|nr:8-oxoguanine deaminase [Betaproteobacteria bacterium]